MYVYLFCVSLYASAYANQDVYATRAKLVLVTFGILCRPMFLILILYLKMAWVNRLSVRKGAGAGESSPLLSFRRGSDYVKSGLGRNLIS